MPAHLPAERPCYRTDGIKEHLPDGAGLTLTASGWQRRCGWSLVPTVQSVQPSLCLCNCVSMSGKYCSVFALCIAPSSAWKQEGSGVPKERFTSLYLFRELLALLLSNGPLYCTMFNAPIQSGAVGQLVEALHSYPQSP